MENRYKAIVISVLVFSLLLSGCGPGQLFGPTTTASPTITNTPTPTSTPTPTATFTPTATVTFTPTPKPVCNPNTTVQGAKDNALPEYIDMISVSTMMKGINLTVVFTVREIPEEITINKNALKTGNREIAWGIAIDIDNNPDTGMSPFMANSVSGYDTILQAFNFKQGSEKSGAIQDLFRNKTFVWKSEGGGIMSSRGSGKITVDLNANTITISGSINGVKPDSYLYFFTFVKETDLFIDEICQR